MRYAQIRKMDIQNGPGVRVSVFIQGCPFHCDGCFNPESWDYQGGNPYTVEEHKHILELCKEDYIVGLSVLGGEPLSSQNYESLIMLLYDFKQLYPEKSVWLWTGNLYENLSKEQLEMIENVDVLVDGPFIKELKDLNLKYRGSSNQRVIDLKKTRETGKIELLEEG